MRNCNSTNDKHMSYVWTAGSIPIKTFRVFALVSYALRIRGPTDSLLERGMIPSNRLPSRPVTFQAYERALWPLGSEREVRCVQMQGKSYANAPLVRYGSAAFTRYMFSNCKEIVTNDPKIPSLKFCASAITSQPDPKQCMLEAKQYHSIHRQQQVKRSMNPEGLTSKVHGFPLENKDAQDATQI